MEPGHTVPGTRRTVARGRRGPVAWELRSTTGEDRRLSSWLICSVDMVRTAGRFRPRRRVGIGRRRRVPLPFGVVIATGTEARERAAVPGRDREPDRRGQRRCICPCGV